MRNSMLVSMSLSNSEVWHNLKKNEIKELELVDEYFLRKIMKCPSKSPKESIYLETGTVPISFILQKKRLTYWYHLITREKHELISKVYHAQKRRPIKGDWVTTIEKDLEEIELGFDEEAVRCMSKKQFKRILSKKINSAAFRHLEQTKATHSYCDSGLPQSDAPLLDLSLIHI